MEANYLNFPSVVLVQIISYQKMCVVPFGMSLNMNGRAGTTTRLPTLSRMLAKTCPSLSTPTSQTSTFCLWAYKFDEKMLNIRKIKCSCYQVCSFKVGSGIVTGPPHCLGGEAQSGKVVPWQIADDLFPYHPRHGKEWVGIGVRQGLWLISRNWWGFWSESQSLHVLRIFVKHHRDLLLPFPLLGTHPLLLGSHPLLFFSSQFLTFNHSGLMCEWACSMFYLLFLRGLPETGLAQATISNWFFSCFICCVEYFFFTVFFSYLCGIFLFHISWNHGLRW